MGEMSGDGGSNAQTDATAKRFKLRSSLVRANKTQLALTLVLGAGLVAIVSYSAVSASTHADIKNTSNHGKVDSPVQPASSDQNTDNTQSGASSGNDGANTNTTRITVNGQEVAVPANGTYEHSSNSGDSQTHIRVNNQQQSSSSGSNSSNSSSSDIHVNVQTDSPPD